MDPFHLIVADGAAVSLDLEAGHIRSLVLQDGTRDLSPFHRAPWLDDPAIAQDTAIHANLRHLAGDFFCAPFGTSDVEAAPPHGWPANSPWVVIDASRSGADASAAFRLVRTVMGATVEKRFKLKDGHPFLYQTHTFHGGHGAVPVANHAMATLPEGGRLAFSAKTRFETPDVALEPDPAVGRSRLAYPAATTDPTRMPLADGGFTDLTRYPIASRHDDFVMMVEARENNLGWLAVSRPATRDAMLSLKSPSDYPVTFLWFSNGGRDYPPWNGRHLHVLGVEEGRSYSLHGHRASIEPNPLSRNGFPTALTLEPHGTASVRNVIGAVALPESGAPVIGVEPDGAALLVSFEDGTRRAVPFDTTFLTGH